MFSLKSKWTALNQKKYALPPLTRHVVWRTLVNMLFPNVCFLILAWFTHTARPLINIDYFWAALLFAFPYKPIRWLGFLAAFWAIIFDVLLFVMQLFPFFNLAGARYLASFFPSAPLFYQVATVGVVLYVFICLILMKKVANGASFIYTAILSVILVLVGHGTEHIQYYKGYANGLFGASNYYYIESQSRLYAQEGLVDFMEAMQVTPRFLPLKYEQAIAHMKLFESKKVLFILNESWGETQNPAVQDDILAKLIAQKDKFSLWQRGAIQFVGATVEGEMRELCKMGIEGFAFQRTPAEQFVNCLPNQYRKHGYNTIALHGASSQIYDRFSLYPKMGFQQFITSESLMGKKHCEAFNGICDTELLDTVKKQFAQQDKLFFYWLTLTTHSTYPDGDLHNRRFNCQAYGLMETAPTLCRNFRLQAQFFDGLAELIQSPEMKGVEVFVVGDHAPPVLDMKEHRQLNRKALVAWLHFKIKP